MNNNIITSDILSKEIDGLSKKLYLESPDLWLEFCGKTTEEKFDEMGLFFAIKYKYYSMVIHAIKNNLINLDLPSKNKAFSTIRAHLLSIAEQNKDIQVRNFLMGNSDTIESEENVEKKETTNKSKNTTSKTEKTSYIPKFICSHCNENIFEAGYIVSKESTYKFSSEYNNLICSSNKILDTVVCDNCKNILKEVTPNFLSNLCTVQNCSSCGLDLTTAGIIDKVKMNYDKELNKFVNDKTSYHCSNCDKELNDEQIKHFNL